MSETAQQIEGPVELIVVEFHGSRVKGDILPALREVVENGTARIVDLVFIRKDDQGRVALVELADLQDPIGDEIDPLVEMVSGLIAEDDARLYAGLMDNDSAAAVLLLEHRWAARLGRAVRQAGGILIADELIPNAVVHDLIAAYGAGAGTAA